MRWLQCMIVIIYLVKSTIGYEAKIVIVGAGSAGVAAASKLYENGFENVTILEAENRIGGRVHTTWFDESWIDLGGQWVHGETNNIVFQLAWPLGLLEIPINETSFTVYDSEGCPITTQMSNDLFKIFFDVKNKAAEDLKGNNGSVGEYFTRMITIEGNKYPAANQTLMKQFMNIFQSYQNSVDASDSWYNTSARGYIEYWDCPGSLEVNWKDKGYATILDILMKFPNPENELPVLNNTLLNSEVVNIHYNSTEGKVLVKSSNGEEYTADHVIVTLSLGVLKDQYETLFTPKLPESKVKTIKGLSMGTVAKIYISFETEWWSKDSASFVFLWNESDRQEYKKDLNKKWLLDLIGFFAVTHKPRILCGWLNGPGGRYQETLPEDQVLNQTLAILDKFLGKSYNITRPTGILRSNWYSNKHFKGTYSFRSMETEEADVWADDLAAPLTVNDKTVLMFAGEATHSHYYSTVHGAIESGFREADRLLAMHNKSVPGV